MTEPTTTSYAVLGLLALRPCSAYELTQQYQRTFRHVWPRSEANLYAEPKRLVDLGWALSLPEQAGRRNRTSYRITAEGRDQLRRWLGTQPARPLLEIEGMVRLLHADHGGLDELRAALESTRRESLELLAAGRAQVGEYAIGAGPYPERSHILALLVDGYVEVMAALVSWCDRAVGEIAGWESTIDPGSATVARRILTETARRHPQLLSADCGRVGATEPADIRAARP